jgi:hypothetical protein
VSERQANDDRQLEADSHTISLDEDLRRKAYRAALAKRALTLSAITAVSAVLIMLTVLVFQSRDNTQATRGTQDVVISQNARIIAQGKVIQDLSRRIISCTDHKGKCYKAGLKRSADVVGQINEYAVLASACAVGYADAPPGDRVRLTRECLLRFLP